MTHNRQKFCQTEGRQIVRVRWEYSQWSAKHKLSGVSGGMPAQLRIKFGGYFLLKFAKYHINKTIDILMTGWRGRGAQAHFFLPISPEIRPTQAEILCFCHVNSLSAQKIKLSASEGNLQSEKRIWTQAETQAEGFVFRGLFWLCHYRDISEIRG